MLSGALPLDGIPAGLVARAKLTQRSDGSWHLPQDRRRRTKLTVVTLSADPTADGVGNPADVVPADSRLGVFVYGSPARRWPSIAQRFGEQAWAQTVDLCRAGVVTVDCDVVDGTRVGKPRRWQLTEAAHALHEVRSGRSDSGRRQAAVALAEARLEGPWVDVWLNAAARAGLLSRAADDRLIERAVRVVAELPYVTGGDPVTRASLAARLGGKHGAHALDDGHRLTALVLRAAAALIGEPAPTSSSSRRQTWAAVGVTTDTISATVIVANLRPVTDYGRWLRDRAAGCHISYVNARDVAGGSLAPEPRSVVLVCENPQVLEACVDAGVNTALLCTQGIPARVAVDLIADFVTRKVDVRYRGDFDWPGITFGNRLISETGCGTWLFDTATYTQEAGTVADDDAVPLAGRSTDATWDATLSTVMALHGVAVHEEQLLDRLVGYASDPI